MNTLITAFLLAAQSAQPPPDLSRFNQVMEMERQASHSAKYAEAERLGREAELIAQGLPDPEGALVRARNALANTLAWRGRDAEAIELLEKTLPLAMKLSPSAHLATALQLGASYVSADRLPEAALVLRRAVRAAGPGEQREVLAARSQLAGIETYLGRRKAARALFLEILAEQTRLLGRTHEDTLSTLAALVLLSLDWKGDDETEQLALRYIRDNAQAEVAGHPSNAFGQINLGILDTKRKRYVRASQELRRALGMLESAGHRGPNLATVLDALALVEIKLGHLAAALELRREAVAISVEAFGPRHRFTALMLYKYADLQARLHFRDEARQNKAKAIAIARESSVGSPAGRTIEWDTLRREAGR